MSIIRVVLIMFLLSGCAFDKAEHLVCSGVLNMISYSYYDKNTDYSNDRCEILAFITSLAIGFLKELHDKEFDWNDIFFDMVGSGIGQAVREVL